MKHPVYICGLGLFLTLPVLYMSVVPPEVLGFAGVASLGCLLAGLLLGNLQRFKNRSQPENLKKPRWAGRLFAGFLNPKNH